MVRASLRAGFPLTVRSLIQRASFNEQDEDFAILLVGYRSGHERTGEPEAKCCFDVFKLYLYAAAVDGVVASAYNTEPAVGSQFGEVMGGETGGVDTRSVDREAVRLIQADLDAG